jgi:CubicO group peptidase (beta-lactamase class C family)
MMRGSDAVAAEVERAIAAGTTPGAAIVVGRGREVLFEDSYGRLSQQGPPVSAQTLYDVSSLTKPLATLACLLRLMAAARISFSTRASDVLESIAGGSTDRRRADITVLQLAGHASGLPARAAYFEQLASEERRSGRRLVGTASGGERVVQLACAEPLIDAPGHAVAYSDVGYILLGALIERVAGATLNAAIEREVLAPLSLRDAGFVEVESRTMNGRALDLDRVAPADQCPWRKALVHGVVQDENAYAMGGVAGHAGLFATARHVHVLAAAYVDAYLGKDSILEPSLVRQCWQGPGCIVAGSTWAVGWDTPTPGASSAGRHVSARAFGHLGFTGTSLWIDLERGVHVVLLTNRVHPDKAREGIRELRPRVHDAIFEMLDRG